VPLTCPYCNALVSPPAHARPGQRLTCPRCGEAFPYRPSAETAFSPLPTPDRRPASEPAAAAPTATRWSNRAIGLTLLAIMATMAVVGLTFAELTTPARREHDQVKPKYEFVLPTVALVARVVYVTAIGLYLLRFAARREPGRGAVVRIGAGFVVALLALVALEDVLTICGAPSLLVPPRFRRQSQPTPQAEAAPPTVPPSKLPALGYLPEGTDTVVALHVREALNNPVGKDLLARLHLRVGQDDFGLDTVERLTGLKGDDIDHAVLGLKVEKQLLPPLTLVVQTRQPYAQDKLLAAVKAERRRELEGKVLHRVPVGQFAAWLWFASDRTLVLGLTEQTLKDVPQTPVEGTAHLQLPVARFLEERLTPGTQAWAVGHSEAWEITLAAVLLGKLPKEDQAGLTAVQTFGVWLQFDEGVSFNAAFRCASTEQARAFEAYLEKRGADLLPRLGLLGNRQQTEALTRELSESLRRERKGAWIDVQARAGAAAVEQALSKK
jgi:hypothetical protein